MNNAAHETHSENNSQNYRPLDQILDSEKRSHLNDDDMMRLPFDFAQAACHTAIQTPIDSIAQMVAPKYLPNLQIIDAPEKVEPLSARWHAQQIGAAAGAATDIIGLEILSRGMLNPALAGACYDGLLRPVQSGKENDQLFERMKNAAIGGVTFGTLAASSRALGAIAGASENAVLKTIGENPVINKTIAGIPAGLIGTAMSGGHTVGDFAMGAYTSAFTGLGLGAIHAGINKKVEHDAREQRNVDEKHELNQKLNDLNSEIRTDHLTGLGNRKGTDEALQNEFDRALRTGQPISLIYGDLDGFKAVNDNLGHDVGDGVLTHVAGCLKDNIRPYDYIGRVGGDEFVIVMPNTTKATAEALALRLERVTKLELVESAANLGEAPKVHAVGISLGVVTHKNGAFTDMTAADFRKRADQEMYRTKAKRKGLI